MAKVFVRFWCILLFCYCYHPGISQTRLTQVYLHEVGVREATGHNDGLSVEMYLHSVGLGKGYPWCAAFVHWCFQTAGIHTTINGGAPSAYNPKAVLWVNRKLIKEPLPGDVFTLWFPSLHRIAHTGFYHKRINNSMYQSVEGNTNEAGSREGDGVYIKYRSFNATYAITSFQ